MLLQRGRPRRDNRAPTTKAAAQAGVVLAHRTQNYPASFRR